MGQTGFRAAAAVLALLALGGAVRASAAATAGDWRYRQRGNRWEGVREAPVNSFDNIVLVSALIEAGETSPALPTELRLRFFLPAEGKPTVVVREVENRLNYWLDQVSLGWKPDAWNELAWPTAEALGPLNHQSDPVRIAPTDLGALVRLGPAVPSFDEWVAPALLSGPEPAAALRAYVFSFQAGAEAADARCAVYPEGGTAPVFSRPLASFSPGEVFSCRWPAAAAPAGAYRLTVERGGRPVLTVRFRHLPSLPT